MNTEMPRLWLTPLMRGLVLCIFSASASAAAIPEVESNDSFSNPQKVAVPAGGLTISARIGAADADMTSDLDFYTFDGTEGDTPSISIAGALQPDGSGSCLGFPSNIALFDSTGNLVSGSSSFCDTLTEARINKATLPATGKYVMGVSSWSHIFMPNGEVDSADAPTPGGTYQLAISAVRTPNPPVDTPPPTDIPPPVDTPPS